jgi:hypothetical protein
VFFDGGKLEVGIVEEDQRRRLGGRLELAWVRRDVLLEVDRKRIAVDRVEAGSLSKSGCHRGERWRKGGKKGKLHSYQAFEKAEKN